MNDAKHTKGPWHVSEALTDSGTIGKVVRCESGARIADTYHGEHNGINRDGLANARLIAAAPDLLEACKAALSCMAHTRKECLVLLPSEEWTLERGNYREDCKCEIATVRAAIRKAEGRS